MPILFVVVIAFVLLAFGQNNNEKYILNMGFKYIPSGTAQYQGKEIAVDGFYIFETEITNKQYQEFLYSLVKKKNWDALKICRIDSANWNQALNFENTYAFDYHLTSQFAEYPVVNISYDAAKMFCAWLEDRIQAKVENAVVRLPTEYEWVYAAKGGNPDAEFPWDNTSIKNKKDVEFCNYNSPDDGTCLATNYARSYFANAYGLYNMSGNVSEWLNTPGVTKGGSWGSDALQMRIDAKDQFSGTSRPSPYIGFRPVVILN